MQKIIKKVFILFLFFIYVGSKMSLKFYICKNNILDFIFFYGVLVVIKLIE